MMMRVAVFDRYILLTDRACIISILWSTC